MTASPMSYSGMKLGINGLGRIGKLTLWHHLSRKYFSEIVVNMGRKTGTSLADLAHYVERDSTYGALHNFIYGHKAGTVITEIDEKRDMMVIDGVPVKFLTKSRNPKDIGWSKEKVRLVVETTGRFLDPTLPADHPDGSCLGHLEAGAEKVICSAPFKIRDKGKAMPKHAVTTVMGVNHGDYDPTVHHVVSAASCTTTCLAHMIKPLLDHFGPDRILSASMATIHAATSSQAVLDRVPKAGEADLRKSRSIIDNIILTTTGAAKALALVLPDMGRIGFIAESVRVPVATGSLIILVVNLQDTLGGDPIRRDMLNEIYRRSARADQNGYLLYSDRQNVSSDIVGHPKAAAIIEGHETHTRTAEASINIAALCGGDSGIGEHLREPVVKVPITQAVIYGWYDNEFGGYTNLLGDRTVTIAEMM